MIGPRMSSCWESAAGLSHFVLNFGVLFTLMGVQNGVRTAIAVFAISLSTQAVFGQTSTSGALAVSIVDPSGAPVPDVRVKAASKTQF